MMNITVYLGANEGREPALKTAVRELGAWIGEHGHTLVYGGSRSDGRGRGERTGRRR
mgnify:CR=1 FL=1